MKKVIQELAESPALFMSSGFIVIMLFVVTIGQFFSYKSTDNDGQTEAVSVMFNAGDDELDFCRAAETNTINVGEWQDEFSALEGDDYACEPGKSHSLVVYCHNTSEEQIDGVMLTLSYPPNLKAAENNYVDAVISWGGRTPGYVNDTLNLSVSIDSKFHAAVDEERFLRLHSLTGDIYAVRPIETTERVDATTQVISLGSFMPGEKRMVLFDFEAVPIGSDTVQPQP